MTGDDETASARQRWHLAWKLARAESTSDASAMGVARLYGIERVLQRARICLHKRGGA